MLRYTDCRAIVMSTWNTDSLIQTAFNVDCKVERQNSTLSYLVHFKNNTEIEKFLKHMADLGITTENRIFFCGMESVIPDDVSREILAGCLEVNKIWRTFVNGNDQIILINE